MKVPFSEFLTRVKPVLRELVTELSREFSYVSILGTDCPSRFFEVRKTRTSITDTSFSERGFVVRVCSEGKYSEYSFNTLPDNIPVFASEIAAKLKMSFSLESDFTENTYPVIQEENIRQSWSAEVEILPDSVSPSDIISKLTLIRDKGLSMTELVDFAAIYIYGKTSKIFLSSNKDLEQSYIWSNGSLGITVRRDDNVKWFYKSFSGLKGLELLDEMQTGIQEAVDITLELLDAGKIEPGMYDVICSPDVAGLIAHEAFGHGVEMDMFVRERARAVDYLGKKVASPLVSMRDGARSTSEVASYFFDDEGMPGTDTVIIDQGILKTGISDLLSALKLGTTPTGNGRRESFERKAYARMTNTIFGPGTDTLEQMIESIKAGYLLEHSLGGMEDPKTWGIQCSCIIGREIKEGKLTGKIVNPVIITGYVPDMLSSISMQSSEIITAGSGGGFCGKGYKEHVKVSDGGPYLKTKLRLG